MELDDAEESISVLLAELESLPSGSSAAAPLSAAALAALESLVSAPDLLPLLWSRLPSPASLLAPLSAAMDSPSLLASSAFLSLLLHPSSPLYSLFTPLSLLSLLRSLRLSLKSPQSGSPAPAAPPGPRKRKSKPSPAAAAGPSTPDLLPKVLDLLHTVLLRRVRLAATSDAVKSLVETLTTLLTSSSTPRVADVCYRILYTVVSMPEHGDQLTSAVEILRALAPAILSKRPAALTFVVSKILPLGRDVEGVEKATVYLPRFLAVKAPERADGRACAVDAILEIVRAMGEGARDGFVDYAAKMAQGKSGLRLLAVDLMLAMLTSLPDPLGVKEGDDRDDYWGAKCVRALGERCSDSVGGIRARALTNVAQVVGVLSGDERNVERLKGAMGFGNAGLSELLRRRCVDEKAAVRKAALLLVTKSLALIGRPIDGLILKTMGSACSDPLVSIRKAALTALSEVYRKFPDARVVDEWLHAVLPLIADNETSIQEECENLFLELVFDRISRVLNVSLGEKVTDLESLFPNGVLALLKGICDGDVAPCVRKICASLGKKKKLKGSIAKSLINIIKISKELWLRGSVPIESWTAPPGAWQLLSEVSLFTPKAVDWEFLHHHWELLDKDKEKDNLEEKDGMLDEVEQNSMSWAADRVSLLQTISNVSVELPPEGAAELAHNLLRRIEDFNMHLSEVDAHVKTLRTLCKQKATDPDEGNTLVLKWVHQLLSKALKLLNNYLSEVTKTGRVDTFFTPPRTGRKGKQETTPSKSMLQAVIAVFTVGSMILVCPSADLQGIIPLLENIITSESYEPKHKKLAGLIFSVKERAPSLYIQSWVTMGKICLVDNKHATRYIPLFVQELEKSDCAAVRNNIMVVMADFCVRYTALVDCYTPKITISLRDPCEVVRRQSFILLSRLLQRDYVKWKGVFFQFLVSLVDDSEKIRHLSDFLFGNILKVKAPLLAYNSFIEAILVLNGCHAHAGYSDTSDGLQNRSFSIKGNSEIARSKRMHIYTSLLKQMAPEHLLATSAKICAEILAAASDGLLNIDDVTGQAVLQDALLILACKEMRIHPSRSADTADMDDEGGDGAALLAAKGRVVTQVAKKNLIQIAVPIFIELKRLLESKNSPITGCLMECLRVLLKDYKNEFDEILVADKQLQKELIYDMQKYDAAKAKSSVAKAVANEQRAEGFRSPLNPSASRIYAKVSEKLGTGAKIASAVADAAARATARSVLKEVSRNIATPPLHTMSVPRLKTATGIGQASRSNRPSEVLESLRRRQSFEFDDEN